jgi:hypothetical protein
MFPVASDARGPVRGLGRAFAHFWGGGFDIRAGVFMLGACQGGSFSNTLESG